MRYDPERHRRSIRLQGYDYSQAGAYFVTICIHDRACLFGDVVDGIMRLNDAGRMVEVCWLNIPHHFPHVALDAFVVMPNHVHGIIWIVGDAVGTTAGAEPVGAKNLSPLHSPLQITPLQINRAANAAVRSPSKTVGSIVRGFKIGVTKWFRENTDICTVWQRNYYEHIIRDEASLHRIQRYIAENPLRWAYDLENPRATNAESEDEWPV